MRLYVLLFSIAIFFVSCSSNWQDNSVDKTKAKEEVQETLDGWAEAVENSDVEELGKLVSKNAVFWTHRAPELKGREKLEKSFKRFFSNFEMEQEFKLEEIIISGNYAFVRGIEINQITSLHNGNKTLARQRAFSLLRKESDGKWRFYRGMTNIDSKE